MEPKTPRLRAPAGVATAAFGPSGRACRRSTISRAELLRLGLGQPLEAVLGDDGQDRVDAAGEVGAAGGGVVVGRCEKSGFTSPSRDRCGSPWTC